MAITIRYEHNTDHDFTQLLIEADDAAKTPLGVINWFAIHPVSLNSSNHLISGDNKGLASLMMEKKLNSGKVLGKVAN